MASSSSSPVRAFLELRAGDPEQHADLEARYDATASHLQRVGASYGWEADVKPEDLDDEAREILVGSDPNLGPSFLFTPPNPLSLGRLILLLNPSANLKKTRENFIALLTGSKGVSKSDRSKKLHYGAGCPVHRIESGFVMQSGDVTRGDGSGGEAALGGTIKAEAEGLAITPKYGSLCMASGARKDSITSQFFIVLATEANQLAKLGPKKYVCFGDVLLDQDEPAGAEGAAVLRRVELYGSAKGTPTEPVWIEASGML
ncbi:unnamed protein product [Tilletia controversa]|uniref:peptidylprolyl isomerase n=3 Tax=Tilletia TaxID=13289 RepID=A0A8X7MYZ9_9BASI|nr:hypothetical protein CF336_g1155 [Tilletia laevis]KAE8204152.1 hypothetical protein CF328_g1244 [Tilletia controversa]KAE8264389.1 hypothetical protein A4X03_0g975 [Tilletia caries]KAE8207957.1 hypothetical protein CF335_g765 [Tilletia laevis]KAE8253091.1 hypothetical protein A4X06_0g1709 [Tilletia controversa]